MTHLIFHPFYYNSFNFFIMILRRSLLGLFILILLLDLLLMNLILILLQRSILLSLNLTLLFCHTLLHLRLTSIFIRWIKLPKSIIKITIFWSKYFLNSATLFFLNRCFNFWRLC